MDRNTVFGEAKWVAAANASADRFYILRRKFSVKGVKEAKIRVIGFGFFNCYINGERVSDELFLPLNSNFEKRENFPVGEELTAYRCYVSEFDIAPLLKDGENTLTIHFGGGWYTFHTRWEKNYGYPKVIYSITGQDKGGKVECYSSEEDRIGESFVKGYHITTHETIDFTDKNSGALSKDFDDSTWENAKLSDEPETEYCFSDCPKDRVCEVLDVRCIKEYSDRKLYDCGKNTSTYPRLKVSAKRGETVKVVFSEELKDGELNPTFNHRQVFEFISDGDGGEVIPYFSWFGFRYFEVYGDAEPICVEVVHTDTKVTSSFKSDNELLNWLHDTFINTQLTNMHAGIPSDCPHLERLGYTGDGELACHAAMSVLDAESFYRKWMQDIADCQDKISGHIQYTSPYAYCGGGPGGWGCAIVEVPYQFYKHYGDVSVLKRYYPNMLRYFDFLEEHSTNGLVTSDMEGKWCLGDWCTPIFMILPPPFINNYFYIKSLKRCIEIAKIIGKEEDIKGFEEKIAERKAATSAAYYDKAQGNCVGCQQGSNAFAVEMGLGDERTYSNLVAHYEKLGGYDTGIFGTDIVTRLLFERGNGELAVKLLTSENYHSFSQMKKGGATTIWEYWPGSLRDRSHNHPMFGAVVAYLYDYLLGIRQEEHEYGYSKIIIAPVLVESIGKIEGYRALPSGKVGVKYEKKDGKVRFEVEIPDGISAEFVLGDERRTLKAGLSELEFDI